ncbi:MAG: hypothetical protein KF762_08250 [Acidobacteria bacterium]|nr:hypothetical protein [Acidobacteriota bacterium]
MNSTIRTNKLKKVGPLGLLGLAPTILLISLAVGPKVAAHGGEDHGDQKPKTETTAKGAVLRTTRLGDFELTIKHPPLEPGMTTHGSLFVSRYDTNEPVDDAGNVQVALEAPGGSISDVAVAKSATAGSYALDVPALTDGEYALRVTLTAGGKASTATFSGVEVRNGEPAAGAAASWSGFLLTAMFLTVGIGLFAALVYLSMRVAGRRPLGEETVSA